MGTENQKRKQTMQVLDQLKASGMPPAARARNDWTGEELPVGEEESQANYDAQKKAREQQAMLNRADLSAPTAAVVGMESGMKPGPTGLGTPAAPGMVPYSPEEMDRRSGFSTGEPVRTGITALDKPMSETEKRKRAKQAEADDVPDDAAPVSGGY